MGLPPFILAAKLFGCKTFLVHAVRGGSLPPARPPLLALVVAAALVAGCESSFNMAGSPAVAPLGQEGAVRAILAPGASGTTGTIDNPSALPEAGRAARPPEG